MEANGQKKEEREMESREDKGIDRGKEERDEGRKREGRRIEAKG